MMKINATPYADINALLEQLLSGIQKVLDKKLVGVYLYGSLVTGDFDKEVSDIDLLVATFSDVDDEELAHLHTMHDDFAHKNIQWDGRIEVSYLSVIALKTYKSHSSKMAVISPGEALHTKDAGIDWLINWYTVREKGVPLFGPPPETLIDPILKEEYIHAVIEHAKVWREWIPYRLKHRPSQAYAILTMCRALYTLEKGEIASKKQAAIWAEQALPEWSSLIQNALLWRKAWRDKDVDHDATQPETLRFVNFVIDQCENYRISKD